MLDLEESALVESTVPIKTPLSNLQWYLDRSRNVVYFAAEGKDNLSESELENVAQCFLDLAPELASRVDRNQRVSVNISAKDVCEFETTTDLKGSLTERLRDLSIIFEDSKMPNFRAYGFQAENPQQGEAKSVVIILASHALTEGAVGARIARGRSNPTAENQPLAPLRFGSKVAVILGSPVLAMMHLGASLFKKPDADPRQWALIDLDRKDVRGLAKRLKVRQRSLLFSLILFGLKPETGTRQKPQTVGYSMLPNSKEKVGDPSLQFRMQFGRFDFADRFEDFVRMTDAAVGKENISEAFGPALYDSILAVHRRMQKMFPFLYGDRFFNYVPYDFVLSLVPPYNTSGPLRNLNGSVFCGSNSPGGNCCIFVPHRTGFSISLSLDSATLDRVGMLTELLDDCEISYRRAV